MVNSVKSRLEIVEMMERIYDLIFNRKIKYQKAWAIIDALDWVLNDSNSLDDTITLLEKDNGEKEQK